MSRTLIIVKPGALARGLLGEIVGRFEDKGLRVVAAEVRVIDEATARRHYAEHDGKEFFARVVTDLSSGPAFVAVLEGPDETWRLVRAIIGATDPLEAAPGTIRGDLATSMRENLVHGADSIEAAEREIAIFFHALA